MEKTNINVSPYYDDFSDDNNFYKVLFRPGYAVQARELTQLQSILQNQVEKFGRHMFKEGTIVIPGAVGFTNNYSAVKLDSTLSGSDISAGISDYIGKTITGSTTAIEAEVIDAVAATTADPITLYVKYTKTGSDNVTSTFSSTENISASGTVGAFGSGIDSAKVQGTATGSSASVEAGVFFVRGSFVKVLSQRLILDKYTNTPSYRVGFTITETLVSPESDSSLLDNATGSTNINAKGAHRLKITLTLDKKSLTATDDTDFIELLRVSNGNIQKAARATDYSVLAETFARRTYDESGDYTVRPFDFDVRETLDDGFNNGIYTTGATTDSGNTAAEKYMTLQISPGKAYVRGYEIETIVSQFIDVEKPRTYDNYNAAVTAAEVGNYTKITNLYNIPDTSPFTSGNIDEPFRTVVLYDTATATRGSSSGTAIGVARARAIEHSSGNDGSASDLLANTSTTDSLFKLYLFDIRLFTKLTMSGTASPGVTTGAKVIGVSSGAYGYVTSYSSGSALMLASVVGQFVAGEKLTSTSSTETDEIIEDSSNADLTISTVAAYSYDKVKQVYMDDPTNTSEDFTADISLTASFDLSGAVTNGGANTTLSGFQTDFANELVTGDVVAIPSGSSGSLEEFTVSSITSNSLTLSAIPSNAITSVTGTRKRGLLNDQNKNILLRKLRKNSVKTLKTEGNVGVSDTSIVTRKTLFGTSSSNQVLFSVGANESFNAVSNTDYVLSVLATGTGSAVSGDIINLSSSNVTVLNSGSSLSITSASLLGDGAEVKLVCTITGTTANEKTKTRNRSSLVLVDNDGVAGGAAYGSSSHHKDISLGRGDVYKLLAIYDSNDTAVDPVLPQWTLTGVLGTFTKGEAITGGTSGAIGTVVNPTTPITYVLKSAATFTAAESITGAESSATATLDTFTAGSTVITNNYTLDNGQRDNYYDIARLVKKPTAVTPNGRLLVIVDYFDHGAGDFFTVDSYTTIDYKDIPQYSATRVDPEVAEPTGEYDLRDSVDFRPKVANTTLTSSTIQNQSAYKVTSASFNFESRSYAGTGSSVTNIPKDNSSFMYDVDYYLGRIDSLYITAIGDFKIISGAPSSDPIEPKGLDNAMKLGDIMLPPYVLDIKDINFEKEVNRRYTMKDISRLDSRISNIEYYTALNLLEKDAASFQIQDANGLDRFKSGFLVDNFSGHAIGDVKHSDYRNSIDMENNELRPKFAMKGVALMEENTTDSDRTNDNYQKTGDLVTLPYEHTSTMTQPYATRVENLNPSLNFAWAGICKLSPSGDEWFETETLPDLIVNREGNFDTLVAQVGNAMGTVWNSWQTQWTGTTVISRQRFRARSRMFGRGLDIIERTVSTTRSGQTRSGVNTRVVQQIDRESQGTREVSRAMIPFMRSRNITFTVTGLKPLTKVYPFFDKTDVSNHVTPNGGAAGGDLISTGAGSLTGTFLIPNPNTSSNPRFRTGERVFRVTSSSTNVENAETFAQANYTATGTLISMQETIIATRNGRIETTNLSENRVTSSGTTTNIRAVGWWDPLAQSFIVDNNGGEYITKIDVFFSTKDDNIPVNVQIREMVNGYPTRSVLPFASKTLEPADINISTDASTSTTFTFDSPVYVKNNTEYAIVLFSDSQNYHAWISRMGEYDVSTNRFVSKQPLLGVLFKSQNDSTWIAHDMEDLKFNLYRAKFDTSKTGTLTLTNDVLPVKTLANTPIQTFNGVNKVKVSHKDHHMYDVSNNVTIAGVVSDVSNTLSAGITSSDTSLSLTTSTGWPSSGTIYVKVNSEVMSGSISGATISSLTRAVEGAAAAHASGDVIALYQVNGIPLTEINKTHTAIGDVQIDSYTVSTAASATSGGVVGGEAATATENAAIDQLQALIPTVEHPDTTLTAKVRAASGSAASGSQVPFTLTTLANAETFTINENHLFANPMLVASPINETNEMAGAKSLRIDLTMNSDLDNLSPVIDLDKKTVIAVANRIDNIDSSSDVYPTSSFVSSTDPEGDSNEAIYITRKVQLNTPATALKTLFASVKFASSDVQVMYKILRSDDASDFDELGWTSLPQDGTVNDSTNTDDFIDYEYAVDNLDEFIAFSIKIRMQGTNSAEVPRIKDFRTIALAL
jgi:hypothetical protein